MLNHAFASIPVPERQAKPRTRGLNMMIDWGMGLSRQADTLDSAGAYIDNAKIAGPIPRVMPRDVLERKLGLYREHGIAPMIGGLFTELAYMQGNAEKLFDEALSASSLAACSIPTAASRSASSAAWPCS